jgi:hypothetical protein
MTVKIMASGRAHADAWAALRTQLWPDGTTDEHRAEIVDLIDEPSAIGFMALSEDGAALGFAEATLRSDYVNDDKVSLDQIPKRTELLPRLHKCADHRSRSLLISARRNMGQNDLAQAILAVYRYRTSNQHRGDVALTEIK